ncbi:hypothetical protein PO909_027476 [Leuciscus waleckii]
MRSVLRQVMTGLVSILLDAMSAVGLCCCDSPLPLRSSHSRSAWPIRCQLLSCDPSAWCEIGSQFGFRFSTQPCYIWHSKFATYREASGVRLNSQQLQHSLRRTGTSSRARHARLRV